MNWLSTCHRGLPVTRRICEVGTKAAAVARWRGAAVVLANVLLFGAADKARLAALLGEALRPGAWVLSTAPLADARLARRQEGVHVKTSWTGGAKVDVYQVVGAP